MRRWSWSRILAVLVAIETAYLAFPLVRDFALGVEEHPAVRGRRVAARLGCFGCHGPDGRGAVPNPGSKFDSVPAFTEQTLMMFVKSDAELREYILDGAPHRRLQSESYRAQIDAQAIQMPAFRGWLSAVEVDALVAYLRLVSGMLRPKDEKVTRGEKLATDLGCFACHGEMGMGGRPNPGSLKGYIPGFLGEDFRELVRSDEELMTWLRDGALPRISEHALGRFFFNRQRIRMPAYKRFVSEEDLAAIAAYVHWLADGEWQHAPLEH
jgi:mono/diheme cytochrome c family protein